MVGLIVKGTLLSCVRYLHGSSSTNNCDHDHQRLLAVARIGQKPTMDKLNKYFNLFWCSLLFSTFLGFSIFSVQEHGTTINFPQYFDDNYADTRTKGEAKVRKKSLPSK